MGTVIALDDEYRTVQERLALLARRLTPAEAAVPVPACPGWSVRDVCAHLCGVAADVVAGNMEGAPSDAWTARHVADRAGMSVLGIVDEWDSHARALLPALATGGGAMTPFVIDAVTHELDIRCALGLRGSRDSWIVTALVEHLMERTGRRLDDAGVAPLLLSAGGRPHFVGTGGRPQAAVTAPSPFEVFRMNMGRRSLDQVREWKWVGDPSPYLSHLTVFEPRADPLVETAGSTPARLQPLLAQWDVSVDHLGERLEGIDDSEWTWAPAPAAVQPQARHRADPSVRTIAWTCGHLGNIGAVRASWVTSNAGIADDDLHHPRTASAGLEFLWSGLRAWRDAMATLSDEDLDTVGRGQYPNGLDRYLPILDIAWWMNRELIHHASDAMTVRDLYASQA